MKLYQIAFLFSLLVLSSCGNSKDDKKEEKQNIKINQPVAEKQKTEDGVTEILLTGNDQMRYNLKEIKVKAGDKVKLTLKHIGKLDVNVMGHNFVLLKPGTNINDFATKAVDAKDNNYIPKNTKAVIVHTKMIGGGEQTTITFDAPEKGVYDFICSFPGHVALMQGKFIVE
ncbi:azurin [Flavobacterium sp. CS20]|jgi:azurin|uniref:azurin n=1 Tax=Flavobacterium sp. CS20 TaxID=2775246 RepID=UPI001B3A3B3C|nr:azurin [Flavobacterium sp. CS20]QTY27332.1 azurin [Flavobacterium sp. CS20]